MKNKINSLLILLIFPFTCYSKPKWEEFGTYSIYGGDKPYCQRMEVPHGWLVQCEMGVTYYPDENHEWKIK
jgi:hypothetical protein